MIGGLARKSSFYVLAIILLGAPLRYAGFAAAAWKNGSGRMRRCLRPAIDRQACAMRRIVADLESKAVQADDRRDDRQAETESRRIAPGFAAIEALQYSAAFGGQNAGAVVEHVDARTLRRPFGAQLDGAVLRRELDRVGDEVAQRLDQQVRVRLDRRHVGNRQRERDALVFGQRRV